MLETKSTNKSKKQSLKSVKNKSLKKFIALVAGVTLCSTVVAVPMIALHYRSHNGCPEFDSWISHHPQWLEMHRERAQYFMQHPEEAEKFRHEWADWSEDKVTFSQWWRFNPHWVVKHDERARYFLRHPDEAEKFRSEWDPNYGKTGKASMTPATPKDNER